MGTGRCRSTLVGCLDIEGGGMRGWIWVGDRTFVLFPGGAIPNSPRETFDEMLWSAIALGCTCHADAMDEEGEESETRGKD